MNGRKVKPWEQANRRQKLGLVWRNRKKISQFINAYLYLPFFLLIILWGESTSGCVTYRNAQLIVNTQKVSGDRHRKNNPIPDNWHPTTRNKQQPQIAGGQQRQTNNTDRNTRQTKQHPTTDKGKTKMRKVVDFDCNPWKKTSRYYHSKNFAKVTYLCFCEENKEITICFPLVTDRSRQWQNDSAIATTFLS